MKKNSNISTALLVLIMLVGLSLLLYPSFSDWWNSRVQSGAIASYSQQVAALDDETYKEWWDSAREYNESLLPRENPYLLSDNQREQYDRQLDVSGNGIMGYVEVPAIGISLPIYHGTDESILQVAIGHLDWTSLPTGGENTHCVISGHRGLPSARLFTDLDKMVVGDYFLLHVLDETLTYQVDQIRIVEPHKTEDLLVQQGEDLCTLVTCTPYGINTHRLLVRGHRTENMEQVQEIRVTADAVIIEKMVVAPFVLAPILLIMMIGLLILDPKEKKRR